MSKKNKKSQPVVKDYTPRIVNKKARFNYHVLEKLECGIVLAGTEVKSLRQGRVSMDESFCRIQDGELFLLGCNISPYDHGNIQNHTPVRPRKLLIHRKEIAKLESKALQKGLTIVPLRIYFTRGWVKLEIGVAKGKSTADKRDKLKKRQSERDVKRAMSNYR